MGNSLQTHFIFLPIKNYIKKKKKKSNTLLFPSRYTLPSPFLCLSLTLFWNVFPMHNFETISLYLVEKLRKMASLFNNTDQQCDNNFFFFLKILYLCLAYISKRLLLSRLSYDNTLNLFKNKPKGEITVAGHSCPCLFLPDTPTTGTAGTQIYNL